MGNDELFARPEISGCRNTAEWRVTNRLVDADEFFELALSTRKLLRVDETQMGLRGLVDPETGVRFVIEEKKLFAPLTGC